MRNVIVTGGSRGIGLGISRHLATQGYRVIAVARTCGTELQTAINDAEATDQGGIAFVSHDLSDINTLQSLARSLRQEFGPIYGLVNNAGIGTSGLLATIPETEIDRVMRMNLVSPLVLTKYVLSSMMAARCGRVVNISSVVAQTGYRGLTCYSATKAGIIGFTRSLARELGSIGITVNAVLPGFIATDMTLVLHEMAREKIARRNALGRLPEVEDVACAVSYLMSDNARNITGTRLVVDSGTLA